MHCLTLVQDMKVLYSLGPVLNRSLCQDTGPEMRAKWEDVAKAPAFDATPPGEGGGGIRWRAAEGSHFVPTRTAPKVLPPPPATPPPDEMVEKASVGATWTSSAGPMKPPDADRRGLNSGAAANLVMLVPPTLSCDPAEMRDLDDWWRGGCCSSFAKLSPTNIKFIGPTWRIAVRISKLRIT